MSISMENLQKMINDGYVSVQKHPTEDLFIYNYTQRAQFDRVWNEETMMCRGLILDEKGKLVARPFKKFFNLEEHKGNLPDGDFEVFDKLDGSLGILYWIGDKPYLATRGSFVSEQAIKGTEILHKQQPYWFSLNKNYTYLFEIIYPENRVVVDYKGMEDIVLLAIVETVTGKEVDFKGTPFAYVLRYDGLKDINKLKELEEDNREGFVVKWENGFRLKVKFAEYVRLHRLVTQVNARVIWDLLRNNQSFDDLLNKVPDEFFQWVKKTKEGLEEEYKKWVNVANKVFSRCMEIETRKEQALFLQEFACRGIVFAMLDGKDYSHIIWKMLKPKAEKPFKQDEV